MLSLEVTMRKVGTMKLSRLVHCRRLLFIYSCKFPKGRYTLGHKLQQQVAARDHSVCTGPATSCSNTLRRHIASSVLEKFVKIFVSATCCCNKILLQRERLSQKLSSTHGAICRCDVSLQHVAATSRRTCTDTGWSVAATCFCNLSPSVYRP